MSQTQNEKGRILLQGTKNTDKIELLLTCRDTLLSHADSWQCWQCAKDTNHRPGTPGDLSI